MSFDPAGISRATPGGLIPGGEPGAYTSSIVFVKPSLIAFAAAAGVRHLVSFHHDPSHTDNTIDRLYGEIRKTIGALNHAI